jgi:hypothetical protein
MMLEFVFLLLSRRLSGVMELVEEVAFGRMDEQLRDYLFERSADGRLETSTKESKTTWGHPARW